MYSSRIQLLVKCLTFTKTITSQKCNLQSIFNTHCQCSFLTNSKQHNSIQNKNKSKQIKTLVTGLISAAKFITSIESKHDPITIAIDCNGLSLLIFEEK